MTTYYYAQFDSTASQPTPVLRWLETESVINDANYLSVDSTTWQTKESTPYVQSGALVADSGQALSSAKLSQIAVINAAAIVAEQTALAFTNAAGTPSSYPMSQSATQKYLGAYTRYVVHGVALPSGFSFYDVNGVAVPFTAADIDSFATAGFDQIETAAAKEASLIAQIQAATTVTAVLAIVW